MKYNVNTTQLPSRSIHVTYVCSFSTIRCVVYHVNTSIISCVSDTLNAELYLPCK